MTGARSEISAYLTTRAPQQPAPAGSCDCQIHVFGEPSEYQVRNAGAHYRPPAATLDDARTIHRTLGIDRMVLVQPAPYKTDHRLLLESLRTEPLHLRGVAIIDETVSNDEIEALHDGGVRAARFNFWPALGIAVTIDSFHRTLQRIAPFGWHAKVFASPAELDELLPIFTAVTSTTMVLDHMCLVPCAGGVDQPAVRGMRRLLERDNWWVMLSNGDRTSVGPPWEDALPIMRQLYDAAPERSIWCSDWPRVGYQRQMPQEAEILEFLFRAFPDIAVQQQILVANPARLFDWAV